MLQILIWAVCVLIIGIGFCGKQLADISTHGTKNVKLSGNVLFIFMILAAILLFVLSVLQGEEVAAIF